MSYSTYAFYIDRLGKDTGFEDKLKAIAFTEVLQMQSMVRIFLISLSNSLGYN